MTSFHAWFSVGGLLAASGGAVFSAADPSATGSFTVAGMIAFVLASGALELGPISPCDQITNAIVPIARGGAGGRTADLLGGVAGLA